MREKGRGDVMVVVLCERYSVWSRAMVFPWGSQPLGVGQAKSTASRSLHRLLEFHYAARRVSEVLFFFFLEHKLIGLKFHSI